MRSASTNHAGNSATTDHGLSINPMTTNPKPLLTRAELNQERKALADMDSKFGGTLEVDCYVRKQTAMLNTIDRMAELLEQWLQVNQVSSHGVVKATHDLLKTFNATGGDGS